MTRTIPILFIATGVVVSYLLYSIVQQKAVIEQKEAVIEGSRDRAEGSRDRTEGIVIERS
jgi:hypothetical protein